MYRLSNSANAYDNLDIVDPSNMQEVLHMWTL